MLLKNDKLQKSLCLQTEHAKEMRLAVSDKYVGLNINFENMTSTFVQGGRIKIQKQNQNI